jgi:Uma2 family endonuclease
MVGGDPVEEEPMTTAPHLTGFDVIEHLIGRDDLTVDDVADLPEDLHYELVHGRLVLTPSPLSIHQNIGNMIHTALKASRPPDGYVSSDQSVKLDAHTERRPDVVAMRATGANRSPVLAADVLLVVEVVSPSSGVIDHEEKVKDYAYAGIPSYWIIDRKVPRITLTQLVLGPDGNYRQVLVTDEQVTIGLPWRVTLDPPVWTRERDWLNKIAPSH